MLTSLIPAGYEGPTLAESFGGAPEQIIAVDVSLDGAVDLLIANGEFYLDGPPRPQHLSVLTNNGDATFAPIVDFPLPAFPNNPESNAGIAFINAADIDDDNDVDVVATAGWNYVLLLFNDGQGGFSRTLWLELEPGLVPTGAETGDLNSDGVVDLVTVNDGPADVSVFIGVGDGSFVHREDLGIAETGPAYRLGAVLGDLDADRAAQVAGFDNDADADIGVVIAEHDGLTYFAGILENRDSD